MSIPLPITTMFAEEENPSGARCWSSSSRNGLEAVSEKLVIHEVFRAVAAEHADRIALRCRGRDLTYEEVDARSDAFAAMIQRAGVEPGSRIAIPATRSAEIVVAMLGILKADCAYVAIDENYPKAVVADYLSRSDVAAVVWSGERTANDAPPAPLGITKTLQQPQDREGTFHARSAAVDVAGGPEAPAYVMFTSGTTGVPKGVVVPHRGVVRLVRDTNYVSIRAEDRFLLQSPLTFDASTFEIWGALLNGATLVIYSEPIFDPHLLRETIRAHRVSILWLTAGLFHLIARHAIESLEGISVLLAGGDVLQPQAVRRVFEHYPSITVINGYGPTENTTFTCCHVMTAASPPGNTVPIGIPIQGTFVKILDAERRPVPRGEMGELYAGGLGVALGYLNSSEATQAAFLDDGAGGRLYRTGDLVRQLEDGTIDFVGRGDNLIKIRGYRVSTSEVQKAVVRIDGVQEAIVCTEDDGSGNRRLVAFVQSDNDPRELKQRIKSALDETLPPYMVPSAIHIRAEFPINGNGKIDARSIRSAPSLER